MLRQPQVVLIAAVGMIAGTVGSLVPAAAAKKRQVAPVTQVQVTNQVMTGVTTKGARVTVQVKKQQVVGQGKANAQGTFRIKLRQNLQRVPFKLKVTKKGYVARMAGFHRKQRPAQATTAATPVVGGNAPVIVPAAVSEAGKQPTGGAKKTQIAWLRAKINEVHGKLSNAQNALRPLSQHQTVLQAELKDVTEDLAAAQHRAAALQGKPGIDGAEARWEVELLTRELTARTTRVTANRQTINELERTVTAQQHELTALKQKLVAWMAGK